MPKLKKHAGFTLLELVMVILILGIIASMSFQLLFQSISGYFTSVNTTDANWQGQTAIQTMSRIIRAIRSPNDIQVATSSQLTFVNMNGNTISYALTGNSIVQTRNNNNQVLADGISNLTFSYFDKNGATTATLANIAYIKITINVTQKNTNFYITTAVFPSNF